MKLLFVFLLDLFVLDVAVCVFDLMELKFVDLLLQNVLIVN